MKKIYSVRVVLYVHRIVCNIKKRKLASIAKANIFMPYKDTEKFIGTAI